VVGDVVVFGIEHVEHFEADSSLRSDGVARRPRMVIPAAARARALQAWLWGRPQAAALQPAGA
jgi:hypothetical protein